MFADAVNSVLAKGKDQRVSVGIQDKATGSHASLIVGAESYHSATSSEFESIYQILKLGGMLHIPSTTDFSKKYELSGYVNYYINPRWTFGLGYRTQFFETQNPQDAPNGIYPYREAYGETFSQLRWNYEARCIASGKQDLAPF